MNFKDKKCIRIISTFLAFSFLIANPCQASLTDALKPPKTDSPEIGKFQADIAPSTNFSLTDPEKIAIANNVGKIKEIFKGATGRLIINIQDAHCNFEAQTNISLILDALVANGLKVVALEGSTGEIDPSLFTTFPDEDIRKEVATYFMKQGKINGAEYLAITSKNPPELYGAETKEYYLANLAAFTNTLQDRERLKTACASVKRILEKLKEHIFSRELKEFDQKGASYLNGNIDLTDYCGYLRQMADSKKLPVGKFVNLGLLYKAFGLEKEIDFNKVDDERSSVISSLESALSKAELDELFSQSVNFKSGKASAAKYYVYLRQLSVAKGIDFKKYPNLDLYTEYLIIYGKMDNANLLKEIAALEEAIKDKLLTNDDQRSLEKLSRNIKLLDSMLDIAMSKEDVEYYKRNKNEFHSLTFVNFIKDKARKYNILSDYDPNFSLVDKYLPDLENFYRIADTRDDAIIENTLKRMDEGKIQVAALITGGYHTEGIAQRLRNRGISYIVIAPRITKVDQNNPYLSILSNERLHVQNTLTKEAARLAINSINETTPVVANEKAEAREVVLRALRLIRAGLVKQGLDPTSLETQLKAEAAEWVKNYKHGPISAADMTALVNEGVQIVLSEEMELLPAAEGTGLEAKAIQFEDMAIPLLEVVTAYETVAADTDVLEITGITYNDPKTGTVSRIFSRPVRAETKSVDHLVDLYGQREELDNKLKLQTIEILKGFLTRRPKDLISELNEGKNIAYCLAALKIKGAIWFCATKGDVLVPRKLRRAGMEVTYRDIRPVVDTVRTHSLADLINSNKPVYVIVDITIKDQKALAHYIVYNRGVASEVETKEVPEELLELAHEYIKAKEELGEARKVKGKILKQKRNALAQVKSRNFVQIGKNIFSHEISNGKGEMRPNFLAGYLGVDFSKDPLGTETGILKFFRLTRSLKERIENFETVFREPIHQGESTKLADELWDLVVKEEGAFKQLEEKVEQSGSRILFDELGIYRHRLAKLKDVLWTIRYDILGNIGKIKELAVGLGLDPGHISTYQLLELRSLNGVLGSIDQRLETRGRDSLGMLSSYTFETYDDYQKFLKLLQNKGLRQEFEERQFIKNLGNFSISVSHVSKAEGKLVENTETIQENGPVTITFVYKVAEVIGKLGDNTKRIKASLFQDKILRAILDVGILERAGVKLAHSRWASAGITSEENCHPVDNIGLYLSRSGQRYEATWQSPPKLYPGYKKMGRVFVVLNGDIENYNREALAGLTVYPNLTEEYKARAALDRMIDENITTDTKTIPLRIEHYLGQGHKLEDAIRLAANDFAGSFAFQVYSDLEPGKVFLCVGGSGQGLYIGLSDEGYHPSSEVHGFIEETQEYVQVKSGRDGEPTVVVIDGSKQPVPENITKIASNGAQSHYTEDDIERTDLTSRDIFLDRNGEYGPKRDHYLDKEISEAGEMWKTVIMSRAEIAKGPGGIEIPKINIEEDALPNWVLDKFRRKEIRKIIFTGMGTADAAGMAIANILLGYLKKIPNVSIEVTSELATDLSAKYPEEPGSMSDTLVVGISQSGGTTDTNTFLKKAANCGASLLGIINKRDSDAVNLIKDPRYNGGVLYTGTGREIEIAVASTKAYYAQIAAGTLYAMRIAQVLAKEFGVDLNDELVSDIKDLKAMPILMDEFLGGVVSNPEHPLHRAAQNWPLKRLNWKVLGCGANFPAAKEVRIKLSEECYMTMPTDALENFKHIDFSTEPCTFILAANVRGEEDFITQNLPPEVDKMLAHNIPVIIITHVGDKRFEGKKARIKDKFGNMVTVPVDVIEVPVVYGEAGHEKRIAEKFSPVISALAGHKLAYEIAKAMDERRAELVGSIIAAIKTKQEAVEKGIERQIAADMHILDKDKPLEISRKLLEDRGYLDAVIRNLDKLKSSIQEGFLNNEFTSEDTDLLNDYYYAFRMMRIGQEHDIAMSLSDFGFNPNMNELVFLKNFVSILDYWKSKLMRTIDSVRHQAKFVTVGTRQPAISLKEAEDILGVCSAHDLKYYEKTAVIRAYNEFSKPDNQSEAQVRMVPYAHKEGLTSVVIVAKDRPGLVSDMAYTLRDSFNIEGSIFITYQKDEKSAPVAILRFLVRPLEGVVMGTKEETVDGKQEAVPVVKDELVKNANLPENIYFMPIPLREAQKAHFRDVRREAVEEDPISSIVPTTAAYSSVGSIINAAGVIISPHSYLHLRDLPKGVKEVLDRMREQVRSGWAANLAHKVITDNESLIGWALMKKELGGRFNAHGRFNTLQLVSPKEPNSHGRRGFYLSVIDGVGAALTNNYGTTETTIAETGSVSYAVYGPGVMKLGLAPFAGAEVLATYIPPEKTSDFVKQPLDPSCSVGVVEATLERIALANNFRTADGKADLSKLRIILLEERPGAKDRITEFERLAKDRGLQILEVIGGSLIGIIKGILPSAQNQPLDVFWSGSLAPQGFAGLALCGALEGSWVSMRVTAANYLYDELDRFNFSPAEIDDINKARPEDAQAIIQGKKIFTPYDVRPEKIDAVIVPITSIGILGDIANYKSVMEHKGIPGIVTSDDGQSFILFPIMIRDGIAWVEQVMFKKPDSADLSDDLYFSPKDVQTYRLNADVKQELASLGLSEPVVDELSRNSVMFREEEVAARRSFLKLLADNEGVTLGEVIRRTLFHERIHNLLNPAFNAGLDKQALLSLMQGIVTPDFRARFELEFGTFETNEQFLEEVLAQYYSARFENRPGGVFDIDGVGAAIADTMGTSHADLHTLFNLDLPQGASGDAVKAAQIQKLKDITRVAKDRGAQMKINFEQADVEVEREVAQARFRARPSGFISEPRWDLLKSDAARRISKEKLDQLKAQGVEIIGDESTIFIEKGVDISAFKGGKIYAHTVITGNTWISEGAVLQGYIHDSFIGMNVQILTGSTIANSLLEDDVKIVGSQVENTKIGKRSVVNDSRVIFDVEDYNKKKAEGKLEEWSYDDDHKIVEQPTVIGEDCVIANNAYVENSVIGAGTKIFGGSTVACAIGADNELHNLKAKLLHTEFDVVLTPTYRNGAQAVAEIQERWIGFGYRYTGAEIYGEGLVDNLIGTPDGIYGVALGNMEGSRVVYSSFTATGKTSGLDVAMGITDSVMKSSAHNYFRGSFGSIGDRQDVIGMRNNPATADYTPLDTTDILPGTVIGPEPWGHVWGPMLGRKTGPRWQDEDPLYPFVKSPNLFAKWIINSLNYDAQNRERIQAALKARGIEYKDLSGIVSSLLKARIELIDHLLQNKDKLGINDETAARLTEAKAVYQAHINSDLWKIENGQLVNWRLDAQGEAVLVSPEGFVAQGLVADPATWLKSAEFYKPYEDPADADPYQPQIISAATLDRVAVTDTRVGKVPAKFAKLKNVVIHPSAQIDETVVIKEGTADNPTIIGAGVVLTGKTVVEAGARLYRTIGQNTTFGESGNFSFVESVGTNGHTVTFAAGADFISSHFTADKTNVVIGEGTRGDHATVKNSSVKSGTALFAYATLEDSEIGANCKIGAKVKGVNFGTGVTVQHVAARVYNTDAPDIEVANSSNLAAGSVIGREGGARVTLAPGSFIGTNRKVGEGCKFGDLCFVISDVDPNTQLPPFTLFQRTERTPDGVNLAGVLPELNRRLGIPYVARFGFGYPVRYGVSDSQKRKVSFRVESALTRLLAAILDRINKQVPAADKKGLAALSKALNEAAIFVGNDLNKEPAVAKLGLEQRIKERDRLFRVASEEIEKAKQRFPQQADLFDRLRVTCENLRDGRFRMRDGVLTDAIWVNGNPEVNNPSFRVQSLEIVEAMRGRFAATLADGIFEKAKAAQDSKEKILVGFGTRWIPKGLNGQCDAVMQSLYKMLRQEVSQILQARGINPDTIVWVHDTNGTLAQRAAAAVREDKAIQPANILLVDKIENLGELRATEGLQDAFVVNIDPANIQASTNEGAYSYLVESVALGTNIAFGDAKAAKEVYFAITGQLLSDDKLKDARKRKVLDVLPRANPVDYNSLIETYKGVMEAVRSA
jgi:glutamine---fructose-6-phosphate transaminase (isomerizing)